MGKVIYNGQQTISTQNLNPALGVPTPNSFAVIDLTQDGCSTVCLQTFGTYTGALTPQVSQDGVNWKDIVGTTLLNVNTGGLLATVTSALQSVFQTDVGGYRYFRLSANAAVTGSVVVTMVGSDAASMIGLDAALPAGSAAIGSVTLGSPLTAATTSITKAEDAVHATADSGIEMLGVRYEALVAAQAAGDYSFVNVDDLSKIVTKPYSSAVNDLQGLTAAMILVADTAVIAAPGASIRNMVTWIHVINTHAAVDTEVQIKDGSTVIDRFYAAAKSDKIYYYPTPLKLTANAVLNAANVTTGSNTYVAAGGYKGL